MNRYPAENPRTGCAAVIGCLGAAVVCAAVILAAWTLAPFVAQALRDGGL